MPFAQLWAVMFFLMLITVGLDTEFGMLEGVVTPVVDMKLFPKLKKEYISGKLSDRTSIEDKLRFLFRFLFVFAFVHTQYRMRWEKLIREKFLKLLRTTL